jgi:hypothetical protein
VSGSNGTDTTWDPSWLVDHGVALERLLWRGVEAQHLVATMKLVDTLDEQSVLERLLEGSKPPLPPASSGLHYLLSTPFRYPSVHPSRFRAAGQPGLWYGAETLRAAASEVGHWRWRFIMDSDGLSGREVVTEHTFFQARVEGRTVDLATPPWSALAAKWTHPLDYRECHRLAEAARAAGIQWIRYASVRCPGAACGAVLDPASMSLPMPLLQQTWVCKAGRHQVLMVHEDDRLALEFDIDGLPLPVERRD